MKVIYILLISLLWVHVAGAQATNTAETTGRHSTVNVQQATPAAKPHTAEVAKVAEEGLSTRTIVYAVVFALLLGGIAVYVAVKIAGSKAESEIAAAISPIKKEVKKIQENMSSDGKGNGKDKYASKEKLEDYITRITDLEALVQQLREKIDRLVAPPPTPPVSPAQKAPVQEKQPVAEAKKEFFFLSTPNSNGTFNVSSASASYREGATIYRFVKDSFNKASFCIDEREASIKLALQYPDKSIDPVCDALNAYNAKATKIVTQKPGTAELQGDKWVLMTKAKITYES
ncbi:hypothetical protein [Chitinophaga sancti]|uniref:Uncharacterized protein n=1 Tax=Chitinophaga sancti TaxID=1004 RepID=A0A1K1SGT2_9BACT|nr:hypothetical protein [Chitinophaga sancti]WQD59867.1 hypothetical protein U0033_18420 [Chitinophaga sancti]WQG88002.1 hypothetical protein SR876_24045 [Chitinophaga sancti]SFW83340.1 hypothetical protein SAMN05661012_05392 [Chitinophaga sancti]